MLEFVLIIGQGIVFAIVLALFIPKLLGRDRRFADSPPGTFPDHPDAPTKRDNLLVVPRYPYPPDLPVASAGLLLDGTVNARDLTATLISLANRGVVKIGRKRGRLYLRKNDLNQPMCDHEQLLLRLLFKGPDTEIKLKKIKIYEQMRSALVEEAKQAGWYQKLPKAFEEPGGRKPMNAAIATAFILVIIIGGLHRVDSMETIIFIAKVFLLPAILGLGIWFGVLRRTEGVRSATGRAYTDQIEGFRSYLRWVTTVDLDFPAGQDIYSQFLPWAFIFGEADMWSTTGQILISEGRIPAVPAWYYGEKYKLESVCKSLERFTETLEPKSGSLDE